MEVSVNLLNNEGNSAQIRIVVPGSLFFMVRFAGGGATKYQGGGLSSMLRLVSVLGVRDFASYVSTCPGEESTVNVLSIR